MFKPFSRVSGNMDIQTKSLSLERHNKRKETKTPTAALKKFSEIKSIPIDWLWLHRIPIGKLTLWGSDPGRGKTLTAIYVAACLSKGESFFDGSPCPKGDTIFLSGEDDAGDTLKPRLDAAGADNSRVHYFGGERLHDGTLRPINLLKIETFIDALDQVKAAGGDPKLIIIDPLDGNLDGADGNVNEAVRSALAGICQLMAKEKIALLGVKHLNKGKNDPLYRVGGSIAWVAMARSNWIFVEDKETGRNLFLPLKNNLAPETSGLEYSIEQKDVGVGFAPFVVWDGIVDDNIHDVMNPPPVSRGKTPEMEAILALLKDYGASMKTGEIAGALGKSEQSISRSLRKLKTSGDVTSSQYGLWGIC